MRRLLPNRVATVTGDDKAVPRTALEHTGPGNTGSSADFDSLMDDLQQRVFDVLPDDTWVYPGHGDDTTIGAERPQLAGWRARGW